MDDAKVLFAWRNDPDTRANSMTADEVPWESHCAWLEASLANDNRDLLVAEVEGVPVGTVRIDRGEETELSWTVAPDARGKGYAKQMVKAACPKGRVIATIKAANVASQRVAAAAGFKVVGGNPPIWVRENTHLAVIDQIEAIRGKNNKNWMDLLRLAFKHAPDEAAEIMAGIYEQDAEISALVKQLMRS